MVPAVIQAGQQAPGQLRRFAGAASRRSSSVRVHVTERYAGLEPLELGSRKRANPTLSTFGYKGGQLHPEQVVAVVPGARTGFEPAISGL